MKTNQKLEITDFVFSEAVKTYQLQKKTLLIFNKLVDSSKISLRNESNKFFNDKINDLNIFLSQLADFKEELLHFYNHEFEYNKEQLADDDWYNQLEIYRVTIILGLDGKFYADTTIGDYFFQDHLLDVELGEKGVYSMQYDG